MPLLGIDVGTGGTRALVMDERGGIVASATTEHAPFASPQTGWAEQDPHDWWRAACASVRAVLTQPGVSADGLVQIFRVDPAQVPSYLGAGNDRGGFSIYRVIKVIEPALDDSAKLAAAGQRIGDQLGRELFTAYVASLKAKSDVKINQANLEKK